jgi:cyclophilin family peptidyl-prolyl cis-trans isomerase
MLNNSSLVRAPLSAAALLALFACGGGGGDAGAPISDPPTVSSASGSAASVKYSQPLLVTINGTNLDSRITVSSPGCADMTRSTTAPNVSSNTTAYYQCRASAVGNQTVSITRSSDGAVLQTVNFAVPVPQVTMALSNGGAVAGNLVITLAPDKTPLTVDNFLKYVNAGFYDNTVIHRLSPNFVVQGGGYANPVSPAAIPTHKTTNAPIALEVNKGLSNVQWTIAMARTSEPNSATSEFFINLVNNSAALDPHAGSAGYAVFGNVSAGTDVVQAITTAPCQAMPGFLPPGDCLPVPNVVVSSAVQTQ